MIYDINDIKLEGSFEKSLTTNQTKWHKSCRLQWNELKVARAVKRQSLNTLDEPPKKYTRGLKGQKYELGARACIFCNECDSDPLINVRSKNMMKTIQSYAHALQDTKPELYVRANCDLPALEAKYHKRCLTQHFNLVTCLKTPIKATKTRSDYTNTSAFAELLTYVEEQRGTKKPFTLSHLRQIHDKRLRANGLDLKKSNSSVLKERILAQIPELTAQSHGRDIILIFKEDLGEILNAWRKVTATSRVPKNWASFLRLDENKTELFSFLS